MVSRGQGESGDGAEEWQERGGDGKGSQNSPQKKKKAVKGLNVSFCVMKFKSILFGLIIKVSVLKTNREMDREMERGNACR